MLPNFETERLILRPRSMADYSDCLAMDRDPEVTRHVAGPWADAAAHEAFLRDRITHAYPPGLGHWSLFPRATPERSLGWMLLIPQDAVGPEVEIGWRLNRASWGEGYAAEAAAPILRHAFQTLALDEIVAEIDAGNVRSMRLAVKIGMRRGEATERGGRMQHRFAMRAADYWSQRSERD
jgi:RimJ/RimL family protein N-acetyltransferase